MTARYILAGLAAAALVSTFGSAPAKANALHQFQGGFYRAPYGFGGFDFRPIGRDVAACAVGDRLERDDLGTSYWVRVRTCG